MEITTHPLEDRQIRMTVTVDEARIEQATRQVIKEIARDTMIPGFRRGKAPAHIIVQRLGVERLRQEVAEKMVEEVYKEAIEREKIKPYAPAAMEEMTLEPLSYQFIIQLPPTVELGNYREYRREPRSVVVEPETVQQVLRTIQQEETITEPVERAAQLGDGVEISLVGRRPDGTPIIQQEHIRLLLEPDDGDDEEGLFTHLVNAVIGMTSGEEKTFTMVLPEDFPQEELRGAEAHFDVSVHGVYNRIVPEIDDDLARSVGSFDTLQELETQIQADLLEAEQEKTDREYLDQVLDDLVAQAEVAYPPVVLEEELDDLMDEVAEAVRERTRLSLDDYLRLQNKTREELRQDLIPQAQKRIKQRLVLQEVVRQERLTVTEEEVDDYIETLSTQFEDRASIEKFLSEDGRTTIKTHLLLQKTFQRLREIALGEAPELEDIAVASGNEGNEDNEGNEGNEGSENEDEEGAAE